MTPSNVWALIIGLFLVGGTVVGGVIWRQNHPEATEELARLVEPLVPKSQKPTETSKTETAKTEAPKPEAPKSEASKPEVPPSKAEAPKAAPEAPKVEALQESPKASTPEPKAPAAPKAAPAGKAAGPKFDVVRVEPTGDAVFAGKSDPNAKVALVEGGKVVSETKADPGGNFVMLPPALKPGDHDLSLQQSGSGKPTENSKQNVAISIPKKPSGQVVVALAEPGKPTKLLSSPPKAPAPATANAPTETKPAAAGRDVATAKPETTIAPPAAVAPKGPDLAIRTVELESGHGFYATGVAPPGTKVEVYLNGAHVAEVTASNDGSWSLTIKKGLTGGHYAVRADAVGTDRKVAARVEVPFDVPVAMGEPVKPPPGPAKVTPAQAQVAAVSHMRTGPDPDAPGPYKAPSPSEVAGLGPAATLAGPGPKADIKPIVPAPRADIAAAAKAAATAAATTKSGKAPPTLAMAPPAKTTGPDAVPAPTPPRGATAPQTKPADMAVAPAKPADAPPTIAATKPSIAPPKRAEVAAAITGTPPAPAKGSVPPASVPFAAQEPPPAANAANVVIDEVETALVIPGDNLWNISRSKLGQGMRYTQIYAANVSQIRNPNLIYPGQVFVVPQ